MLKALDYDPGPIDGLWGSQTFSAISDFRHLEGMEPAEDTTKASAANSAFMEALWGAAINAGIDVPVAPSSGTTSGSTGTRPVSVPTGQGTDSGTRLPTTKPSSPIDLTMILAIGAVAIGAILLSQKGGKKRGR
jgi:hypothetical protein